MTDNRQFRVLNYLEVKTTASAEAAIDEALTEIDTCESNLGGAMRRAKQPKKTVNKLKGIFYRQDRPPVPVEEMSILAPENIRKRFTAAELIAQCDPHSEMTQEIIK